MYSAKQLIIVCLLLVIALHSAFAQDLRYNYDAAGRLVSVIDAQGRTTTYTYDELGNLLSVQRTDTIGQVAITSVIPTQGFIGTQVQIVGFGFSAVANQNAIAFNGVAAPVLAATTTSLTTQVPLGATTGPITVTAPLGSATSPQPFTVLGGMTVSPSTASVARGATQQFTATVTGTTNQSVAWSVNGIVGGNSTVGTITADGLYTAPFISTTSLAVTIKATSLAFPGLPELSATASVTIIATCSVTWTGAGGDNLWQDSANWSGKVLPGSSDDVCIGSGFNVVLSSGAQSINSLTSDSSLTIAGGTLSIAFTSSINQGLTLSGGILRGAGSITISGSSSWSAGQMIDAGTTTFNGNLAISGSNNLTLSGGRTLNTAGTTTVTLTGTIQSGNATINNSGVWNDQSNSSSAVLAWNGFFGPVSTFNNSGTFEKTSSSNTGVNFVFNNTSSGTGNGIVDLQSGTLSFSAGGTSNSGSSFTAAGGTTLAFFGTFGTGTYTFQPGSSLSAATFAVGSGTVNINGSYSTTATTAGSGTVNFNPGATVSGVGALTISGGTAAFNTGGLITPTTLTLAGGTLAGTDPVTFSGPTTWTGGTMTGTGTTTLAGDTTISGNNTVTVSGGRTLNTTATTTVTLNPGSIQGGGTGTTINNSGVWLDQSSSSGAILSWNAFLGPLWTFRNTGTYRKTSSTTSTIAITFNNIDPGVVDLQAGTLILAAGGTETGSFATQPGATLLFSSGGGDFNFTNASATNSVGSLQVNATVNVAGTLAIGGLLDLVGGTLNITGAVTAGSYNQTGTLSGTGTLTVSGPATWSGGQMTDAGTTTFNGNLTIPGNADVLLSGGRTLNTTATTTVLGTREIRTGGASIINNSGLWQDQWIAGLASITNDLERGGLLSTFNNSGIYRKSGATTTTISIAFNNTSSGAGTGVVDLQSGTLGLGAGGTANSGSAFTGATGTTLAFTGSTYTLSAGSSVSADTVSVGGVATINVNGTYNAATTAIGGTANFNPGATVIAVGALTISGNTAAFNTGALVTPTTLTLTGGTLTGADPVTVSGLTTWTSGTMTGSGTTTLAGDTTISGNNTVTVSGGRTLNTTATTTVTLNPGSIQSGGAATRINNAGLWLDQSGSSGAILSWNGFLGPVSTFNNTGTYRKTSSTTSSVGIVFNSSGTVDIQGGSLAFSGGYTQTAGETKLDGGALSSSTTLNIQGGTLSGAGTVTANVSNGGLVSPGASPGILNITGTYTQTSTGALNIEIGGLTAGSQFDQVAISGLATLNGTLNISLINGFVPNPGDSFQIMTFASRSGGFSATNAPPSLTVQANATNVTLTAP